jgi:diacylglycerol kinase family enzyme
LKPEIPLDLAPAGGVAPAVAQAHPLGFMLVPEKAHAYAGAGRVAVVFSKRAHRNRKAAGKTISPRTWHAAPHTKTELDQALATFAQEKIDTIVIDGGDGTVRDVLSLAKRHFGDVLPRFVISPSGKTNALGHDLGMDRRLTLDDVLATLHRARTVRRSPLEIRYGEESEARLRGFVFGTGAYVRSTHLAQSVHRAGAFNGLAVGLSLVGAVRQMLSGAKTSEWRAGDPTTLELDGQAIHRNLLGVLSSTLERMPLGIRPFGRVRSGLKLLAVDAPPRRTLLSTMALAVGSEREWLVEAGFRRAYPDSFRLGIDGDFVLDGETFPGGDLTISKGAPIDFLVPE